MSKDDKHRVIGKIVSINSDRFTVELLTGIENFNINGFDDIHYFAQVNSYVILPYQNYHIVAEVVSVKERDSGVYINNPIEQVLNKTQSVKYIEVIPIGTIKLDNKTNKFDFGVSVYPSLYSDALYIKKNELDCIFSVQNAELKVNDDFEDDVDKNHGDNTRLQYLSIGKSSIFEDYDIKIDIDKFFGGHSAILGNTGSGKSCTIASMVQTLFKKDGYSVTGSSFIFLDVNGEYQQAFSKINQTNPELSIKVFSLDEDIIQMGADRFKLPHCFLNLDEWALLLQASEKTQLPILRNALGLALMLSKGESIDEFKNHILATCITEILRDETGSPSKADRIKSILQKFNTDALKLETVFIYIDAEGNPHEQIHNGVKKVPCSIENCLTVHFGEIKGRNQLTYYLDKRDEHGELLFFSNKFQMPTYEANQIFDFNSLEEALDIAILYEEAHGNKQIRDYCSSMLTRFKSLKERVDYGFLKQTNIIFENFRNELLGINNSNGKNKKDTQIVILDLNAVEDEVVEIIACVISRIIYDSLRQVQPRNIFPVNLILEEAHRYISIVQERSFLKANHIFERIAKEGRKYGMFLLVSSQRPSELSRTVLSQCSNFIVHRIQNPEDLSHIRQITPHISDTILKRMPSIPTQHALIFGQSVNLPATFKVNSADPLPLSDNNRISKNWYKAVNSELEINFKS